LVFVVVVSEELLTQDATPIAFSGRQTEKLGDHVPSHPLPIPLTGGYGANPLAKLNTRKRTDERMEA